MPGPDRPNAIATLGRFLRRGALGLAIAIGTCGPLLAQDPLPPVPAPQGEIPLPDLETLKGARDTVANSGRDEAVILAAEKHYAEAIASLGAAARFEAKRQEYETEAAQAPQRIEEIRAELAVPAVPEIPTAEDFAKMSTEDLEAEADRLRAELAAARDRRDTLAAESDVRESRRTEIPERLAAIGVEEVELDDQIAAAGGSLPADPDLFDLAILYESLAQKREYAAEKEMLAAERRSYDARKDLLPLRRQRAARRLTLLEPRFAATEQALQDRRVSDAEKEAREAAEQTEQLGGGADGGRLAELGQKYPGLLTYAEENAKLTASLTGSDGILARKARIEAENDAVVRDGEARRKAFADVLRQVELVGLSDEIGGILRDELKELPPPWELPRRIESTRQSLGEVQFQRKRISDRKEAYLADTSRVATILGVPPESLKSLDSNDLVDAKERAETLVAARLSALDSVERQLSGTSEVLRSYLGNLQRYHHLTAVFRDYIEERVLWVRSSSAQVHWGDHARDALVWALSPQSWRTAIVTTFDQPGQEWIVPGLLLLAAVVLVLLRRRFRSVSRELAEKVRHHSTDAFLHTWRELAICVCLALPIPIVVGLVGHLLARPSDQVRVAYAVGQALGSIAFAAFIVLFMLQVVRPKRLAEAHLRWPAAAVKALRRRLRLWSPVLLAALFVVLVFEVESEETYQATLGRLAFVVLVVAAVGFTMQTLRPHGTVLSTFIDRNPSSLIRRLRGLWFPLLVAVPVVLGLASLAGYHYTAIELGARLLGTVGFILVLVLVHALLLRWLFAARRRLAVELVRQRARKKAEEAEEAGSDAAAPEGGEAIPDEDEIDIPALDSQTKQIFRAGLAVALGVGLYVIWADKLPALHVLERVEIYPSIRWVPTGDAESAAAVEYESVIRDTFAIAGASAAGSTRAPQGANASATATTGDAPSSGGTATPTLPMSPTSMLSSGKDPAGGDTTSGGEGEAKTVVSLADLGLALLILFFMVIASRNVPGLLEFSVLQRLPLDRGARYAISTIVRYLIVIVGTTVAFSAIGIGWGRVQWLAAAFTFGLAFGLQEIFANFVSGLIILIERPVRVGDVVTVAGVEGRVTRLQMRSTTIQDWDRREFLIPNKEFITGSLLNWTLSDSVSRLVLVVGIAYGSDVRKAERTLLRVAKESPHTVEDPPPNVCFREFGDSTLNFELRIFIPHRELWASATHALHMAIDDAFRAEGIEIAFPQRDLHIRSSPAAVRIERAGSGDGPGGDPAPPPPSATK